VVQKLGLVNALLSFRVILSHSCCQVTAKETRFNKIQSASISEPQTFQKELLGISKFPQVSQALSPGSGPEVLPECFVKMSGEPRIDIGLCNPKY
jgi:hypothetical protein